MKKRIYLIMLVAFIFLLSSQMSFGSEKYVIKFGYTSPESADNFETLFISTFREYVEKESGGSIKVESYPGGQLGGFRDLIEGLMMGTVQMAGVDSAGLTGFYKEISVLSVPGIFSSNEEVNAILAGSWGQKLKESIRKQLGIVVLNAFSKGFRHFTNNVRELRTPDDAKGLKFRVMESPVPIKMVEALGATAVPIPSAEMYSALQQGVVDGQENPIASIIQDRTYEVQKYLVLDGHTASIHMNLLSDKFLKSLPAKLQKVVLQAADKGRVVSQALITSKEETGLKFLNNKLKVYKPSPEEAAQWRQKVVGPTIEYVRSLIGNKPVDELLVAIDQYRKQKK